MKKKFFDFDKLFEDYLRKKFQDRKNIDHESIKEQLGNLYLEWSQQPLDILGGLAPSKYYSDICDESLLIEFLIKSCEGDCRPNSFLLERISEKVETIALLRHIISQNSNCTLTLTAIELLQNMNAPQPLEEYVEILRECFDDATLRETIIEILIEHANSVKESLYSLLMCAGIELKTVIAEILINANKDERTHALLTELFVESDNVPLIASYIGRYGDESLAALLYKALDTCNYMEFIEIKNAIERMGGIVEENYDFSEDAYYKIMKMQ